MKKILLALALLFAGFSTSAQSKIGTIDAEFILSQLPEIAEVNKGLETYNQDLQKNLDSTITKYENLIKDYQEKNAEMTEEVRQEKETQIISLENDIKNFRQKATVMLQMRRNELTKPLYERINEAMVEVVEEEGFTQIFHAGTNVLAFSREDADITVKVLNKLGIKVDASAQNTASE